MRLRTLCGVLAVLMLLPVVAVARHSPPPPPQPPKQVNYRGHTAQGHSITFSVSAGKVRNLRYSVTDSCPAGRRVLNRDSHFPPIPIRHSSFGGTFVDPGKARAIIHGTFQGGKVHGSLTDTVHFHGSCKGKTTFAAVQA